MDHDESKTMSVRRRGRRAAAGGTGRASASAIAAAMATDRSSETIHRMRVQNGLLAGFCDHAPPDQ